LAQGKTGRLSYTGGVFLYYAKAGFNPLFNISTEGPASLRAQNVIRDLTQTTKSAAIYGQGTYALTDATNLTAGLRYTYDKRSRIGVITARAGHPTAAPGTVIQAGTKDEIKGGKLTWRFALDHHFTRDVMVFGSVSRGYKSGTFNLGGSPIDPGVEPEVLDAYEAGFKSQFFDRIVTVNASAFWYDYKNIQLTQLPAVGQPLSRIFNAAEGRSKGIDAEIVIAPPIDTGSIQLRAAATYLDARYKDFRNAPFLTPNPAGGNFTAAGDATGNRMIRSPKFTSSVTLDYSVPVGDLKLGASATWQHSSKFYWEPDNRIPQKAYDIVNGQLTMRTADENLGFRLFARNLFNKGYFTGVSASGLTGDQGVPGEPRVYGFGIDVKFR
jgi:iron complex outermembrane receptor protein